MAVMPFEHADEVRAALRAIVADPAQGAAALSSSRVMPSLLSDLLPDAPREAGLLAAAAQRDVAGMLAEHVAQGLDIGVAVSLVASSFAGSTAFTPQACPWVTAELAIALGLAGPGQDLGVAGDKAGDTAVRERAAGGAAAGAGAPYAWAFVPGAGSAGRSSTSCEA